MPRSATGFRPGDVSGADVLYMSTPACRPLARLLFDPTPSSRSSPITEDCFLRRICCTALPHLNFEWPAVPTELTLGAIKEAVVKRHGGALPELSLYKDVVSWKLQGCTFCHLMLPRCHFNGWGSGRNMPAAQQLLYRTLSLC